MRGEAAIDHGQEEEVLLAIHGDDFGLHQGGILGDGLVVQAAGNNKQDGPSWRRARSEPDGPLPWKPTGKEKPAGRRRSLSGFFDFNIRRPVVFI